MTFFVTSLFSFIILVIVIAVMGIGVIAGRKPLKGSCGGLNGAGCDLCSGECRDTSDT